MCIVIQNVCIIRGRERERRVHAHHYGCTCSARTHVHPSTVCKKYTARGYRYTAERHEFFFFRAESRIAKRAAWRPQSRVYYTLEVYTFSNIREIRTRSGSEKRRSAIYLRYKKTNFFVLFCLHSCNNTNASALEASLAKFFEK